MNKISALDNLYKFLDENPNFKPTEGFVLSEPLEHTIKNDKIYYVFWNEVNGRSVRGGYSYFVLPDGTVLMPNEGSGQPETVEGVYSRWQSQKRM